MIIDRERVKNTFAEYTSGYNATDPKIKLKIDHTYRVAELCELIARDLKPITDTKGYKIKWD